jgi:ATP-dependent Clp protease adaptor protein ClpS
MGVPERDTDAGILEKTRKKTKRPQLYRVVLHNDDYTTQEFVVEILESIFNKSPAEAYRIMMHVHTRGQGICGTYTHEIAETKAVMVHDQAKERGFPLRASVEEA